MNQKISLQYFRITLLLSAFSIFLSSCSISQTDAAQTARYRQGEKLFTGQEPLSAKISGHQNFLPSQFSRCISCHLPVQPNAVKTESAPHLSSAWLKQTRVRRGAPAFSYNQENFCTTLISGIDPEYVVLDRAMPRFDVSNEQCLALWAYLMERP